MKADLFVILVFVIFGIGIVFFSSKGECYACPGYSCSSSAECGTCACARMDGQPFGRCVFVEANK